MQIVASVVVLVAGLYVALLASGPGGLRPFGWILVAVGVLGLAARLLVTGRRGGRR